MKRYISMFLMIIICFVLQTTVFSKLKLTNVMPNLLIILTASSGYMYGKKLGLYTGFCCGAFIDLLYGDVVGISIFIFAFIGYMDGMANNLYFRDDISVPLIAIAGSDLAYGFMFYVCHFLMRGRLDIISYIIHVMIPEMIYTMVVGIIIYKFMYWLEGKMYPPEEVPLGKGEKAQSNTP